MNRRFTHLIYIAIVSTIIGGALLLRYADPFFVRALRLAAFDVYQRLDPASYDPNLPVVETFAEARHFALGEHVLDPDKRPWREPIPDTRSRV